MRTENCVDMKRRIQKELAEEYKGLSPEQVRKIQEAKIGRNKLLSKYFKKAIVPSRQYAVASI